MWWESPRAQLGLLVDASALPMHLSLSLSLSCPSGSPGLTAETRGAANPLGGRIDCCHARGDVLRPRGVASDRTPAYKATNGRQAHCERSCRARGGVAGTDCALFFHSPCRGRHALTRRALATASCAPRAWRRGCFKACVFLAALPACRVFKRALARGGFVSSGCAVGNKTGTGMMPLPRGRPRC